MMNSKLKFFFILSFMAFFLSNCDKNDPPIETTVEEDKENIKNLFNDVITETKALKAGCAMQAIDDFLNLDRGQALNSNWAEMLYNTLESHLNITAYQTNKFNFTNHVGTHSWNASTQNWTASSLPTDKIVLEMPAIMGANSNSVVATAHHYTDQQVSYNNYQYWLPTSLMANVSVNNEDCIGVDLKSATYDNTSFQIPVEMEMHLTLAPYVFEIKAKRTAPAKLNVEIIAKNNGTEKFSLVTDLTYDHANYETLDYFNDCIAASGEFKFGDFTLPFTADFETARSLFNPTNVQINTLFDADVFYKGNEIADLDYAKDYQGYADIHITYKDGTIEDTETYYDDFVDRLELVLVEFTGPWPN
ncbi:hypothetical protein [Aureispira anguillae]|uniref:Uncharacterized protein n=1 Tax=Aureispira anguillae TaxID=2864201 RepID=A0A915YE74_9BACT|nr:hypothetical protein [Aureispira anguillae]BDS11415.1 hypothetical protein AsAng_0021290 [Aureispira anguillae]